MFNHLVKRTADFHKKHKLHFNAGYCVDVRLMRTHLILEESAELMLAVFKEDELQILDALGDIMYVTAGSWVAVNGDADVPSCAEYSGVNLPVHSEAYKNTAMNGVRELAGGLQHLYFDSYELTTTAVQMVAQMGYDPLVLFDRIADSNDTKNYTGDQRVSNKGPNYRPPVLADLCRRS